MKTLTGEKYIIVSKDGDLIARETKNGDRYICLMGKKDSKSVLTRNSEHWADYIIENGSLWINKGEVRDYLLDNYPRYFKRDKRQRLKATRFGQFKRKYLKTKKIRVEYKELI